MVYIPPTTLKGSYNFGKFATDTWGAEKGLTIAGRALSSGGVLPAAATLVGVGSVLASPYLAPAFGIATTLYGIKSIYDGIKG
jgi:hypothetical protein